MGNYNKPLKGSLFTNQYNGKWAHMFEGSSLQPFFPSENNGFEVQSSHTWRCHQWKQRRVFGTLIVKNLRRRWKKHQPWEPKTFIFRGYNPFIGGLKPSFFMVLGSHGGHYIIKMYPCKSRTILQNRLLEVLIINHYKNGLFRKVTQTIVKSQDDFL